VAQSTCYFDDEMLKKTNIEKAKCMSEWASAQPQWWIWFVDFGGRLILPVSEMLAILPYLLRSLRIQKMFQAREIFCQTDMIPKRMIWKWKE
jgi:hypothetical protein